MDHGRGFLARNCSRRSGKRGVCAIVVLLAILIGITLLAYASFASSATIDSGEAQQVAIIFRHGERTPTETYKNDPYIDYKWIGGWGALTKRGMLQMYTLGRWIGENYGWIVGRRYLSASTLVRSSAAERCIMSAQALLAGLFPPAPDEIFVSGLAWRPVPVHPIPRDVDKMIAVKAPCPRLEKELRQAYANESAKSGDRMSSYYAELTNITGQQVATITDVEFLYNTLEIEELHGLTLPEWTSRFYNDEMRRIAARSLAIFTSNAAQRRLRGGPILKEILERMKDTRNNDDWRKMYLYAAHDVTLVNVLRAMGFTEELFKPDIGASLVFELRAINGGQDQEVVAAYVNNTKTIVPHSLSIPGCGKPCLLDELFKVWRDVLPEDWNAECLS